MFDNILQFLSNSHRSSINFIIKMSLFKELFFGRESIQRAFRDLPLICFTIIGTLTVQQFLKEDVVINGTFIFNIIFITGITFGVITFIFFIYYLIFKALNPPRKH